MASIVTLDPKQGVNQSQNNSAFTSAAERLATSREWAIRQIAANIKDSISPGWTWVSSAVIDPGPCKQSWQRNFGTTRGRSHG